MPFRAEARKDAPRVPKELEDALRARLTAILDPDPATEAELRRLVEQADACERILRAQVEQRESRLDALATDRSSSLGEIVAELRQVRALQAELGELRMLLDELDERARTLRAKWLAQSGLH